MAAMAWRWRPRGDVLLLWSEMAAADPFPGEGAAALAAAPWDGGELWAASAAVTVVDRWPRKLPRDI